MMTTQDKPRDNDGVIHSAMTKEKPLSVDEERLKSIIRAEIERVLFDMKCDKPLDTIKEPETIKDKDNISLGLSNMDEETMVQADRRRKKKWAKQREEYRKEIKRKQDNRHKCRKQRVTKEHTVFNRWKELVFG
tara:strand:- start:460 stop:861 length:402 start_codon:yes stop_codon:yes gene_type:complete